MFQTGAVGLLVGAIHGIEPRHGWPIAASYALDQTNKWLYGFAASVILGVGHLISSLAMVAVFFYTKSYFNLTQLNEPITIVGGIQIGGPVSLVAGILLLALGVREYNSGHSHSAGHSHDENHAPSDHSHDDNHTHVHNHHDHEHSTGSILARIKKFVPFFGGHSHSHSHDEADAVANRGLVGIAWFAFVLGPRREFEIIALCTGLDYCLELMSAYALTVITGIVGFTLLLVAGYQHYEEEVTRCIPYLPTLSVAILIIMGIGFITGLF